MMHLARDYRIGGLVVKLAVAIRDCIHSQMIRPAPGSIPGRCMTLSFVLLLLAFHLTHERAIAMIVT
jgi:hypothetical protein